MKLESNNIDDAGQLRVAIIDDDYSVRRSTQRLLSSWGMAATAFSSAEEFLTSHALLNVDCLVLDVRMPGLDGVALQRRLAEMGHLVPIVFLSAQANEEEQHRALVAGAASFLRKPVGNRELIDAICTAIRNAAFPPK